MSFQKSISTTIEVKDPIAFASGGEASLLGVLRGKFVGKCFQRCFILSVDKVEEKSLIRIVKHSGEGSVDVRFSATVSIFEPWEILFPVEIVSSSQILMGKYKKDNCAADVAVLPSNGVEAVAVGQKVPVRIIAAEHTPMQSISIVGSVLTCDKATPVYSVKGSLKPSDILSSLYADINKELALRASLDKEKLLKVESLIYAYNIDPVACEIKCPKGSWLGPVMFAGTNYTNILEIVDKVIEENTSVALSGTWSRPLNIFRSSPLVEVVENQEVDVSTNIINGVKDTNIIGIDAELLVLEMLKGIYQYLTAVRGLIDYEVPESVRKIMFSAKQK